MHYNFADSNTYAGTGTTVYDLTSNDNDGTLVNTPTWVDRANGNYFSFDGSNDQLTTSYTLPSGGAVTYEVWYNPNGNSGTQYILGQGVATASKGPTIYWHNLAFGALVAKGVSALAGSATSSTTHSNTSWHHVVFAWDGSTASNAFKVYVNGILEVVGTSDASSSDIGTSTNFAIAGLQGGTYAGGKFSQVRIYTAELTKSQIRANYDATRTLYQGVGTTGNVLQTGLLNNIDVDSFSSYDPNSFGDTNKAAVLNGSNGQINLADGGVGASGTARQTFSVSLWINTTSTNASAVINDYTTTYSFVVELQTSGRLRVINNFSSGGVIETTGPTAINNGRWHHLVLVNNTGDNTQKLYIDSVLEVNQTLGGGTKTANSFNVGYYTGLSYHLNGKIDQFRSFNKALSTAEIRKLFSETSSTTSTLQVLGDSSCTAAFNFNSDSGTTVDNLTGSNDGTSANVTYAFNDITSYRAKDQTSNNFSAALSNATFNEANNWGTSIKFDGSGDYLEFPVGLGRTATQDVTREFWLKVDDYAASGEKDSFFYCGDMDDNGYYESIAIKSDGTIQYQERNNDSANTGQSISVTTPADGVLINENVWYHVVYTVSGKEKSIYINGKIAAHDSVDYTKVNNSSYPATLGAFRGAYLATFHGEIAQFRSYTSVLTLAQIKANYDATRAQFFSALTHSLVSVSDKAGFSIVKYEGDGIETSKMAHGLSGRPDIIIVKNYDNASASWATWTSVFKNKSDTLFLNANAHKNTWTNRFGAVNEETFEGGSSGGTEVNKAGDNFIAYCWRSIPGYSKISKYKGNGGSSNKILLGFKPGFLMIKLIDNTTQHWYIMDTSLYGDSAEKYLTTDLTDEETSLSGHLDITSKGFTLTKNSTAFNASGYTYLYMAFV